MNAQRSDAPQLHPQQRLAGRVIRMQNFGRGALCIVALAGEHVVLKSNASECLEENVTNLKIVFRA